FSNKARFTVILMRTTAEVAHPNSMRKLPFYLVIALVWAASARAESPAILLSKKDDGIAIHLRRSPKGMELEIKGAPAGVEPEAFALRSPPQLVIDIPMTIPAQFRQVPVAHPDFYSLRYGTRKGKTRLILDFHSNESPQFQILPPDQNAQI